MPLCITAIVAIFFIKGHSPSNKHKPTQSPNWISFIFSSIFLATLTYIIMQSYNIDFSAYDKYIILTSFVSFIFFVLCEFKSKNPILHIEELSDVRIVLTIIILMLWPAISLVSFFMIMYMQIVLLFSPSETSLLSLPLYITIAIASYASGKWIDKSHAYKPLIMGSILTLIGLIITYNILDFKNYFTLLPIMIGIAIGFASATNSIKVIMMSTYKNNLGTLLGISNNAKQIASCISFAVFSSLISSATKHGVNGKAAIEVFYSGFQDILLIALIFSFVVLCIGFFICNHKK